jgi:hypothetical protein
VRSVQRCYKEDQSRVYLVVRQPAAREDMNAEAEEATTLEDVARRQPVKTAD